MSAKSIILVTCAAGTTGKLVVEQLSATGKFTVRAGVRDTEKAKKLFEGLNNVELVKLDETDETAKVAFAGIYGLYLIISAPFPGDQCFPVWFKHAKAVGVKHLVYHSSLTAEKTNPAAINREMSNYQDEIEASGIPYTSLRPTFFYQNIEKMLLPEIIRGTVVGCSDNVPYTIIDCRDLAAAAVKVFENPSAHVGRSYKLTSETTTDADQAKLLTDALGRKVEYLNLSKADLQAQLAQTPLPDAIQELLVELDEEKKYKLTLPIEPDLVKLLGRPAITFEQYIKDVTPFLKTQIN